MATTVVMALLGSRLDYANSVLYGTTQKNISKLQKAQNSLARVVSRFIPTNPILTRFLIGSYITHSLYIYIPSCVFTMLLVP